MLNRATRAAYLVVVRQWWWMMLLNFATTITFFVTGHRWWALAWLLGYLFYAWMSYVLARIDRQIRRAAHSRR